MAGLDIVSLDGHRVAELAPDRLVRGPVGLLRVRREIQPFGDVCLILRDAGLVRRRHIGHALQLSFRGRPVRCFRGGAYRPGHVVQASQVIAGLRRSIACQLGSQDHVGPQGNRGQAGQLLGQLDVKARSAGIGHDADVVFVCQGRGIRHAARQGQGAVEGTVDRRAGIAREGQAVFQRGQGVPVPVGCLVAQTGDTAVVQGRLAVRTLPRRNGRLHILRAVLGRPDDVYGAGIARHRAIAGLAGRHTVHAEIVVQADIQLRTVGTGRDADIFSRIRRRLFSSRALDLERAALGDMDRRVRIVALEIQALRLHRLELGQVDRVRAVRTVGHVMDLVAAQGDRIPLEHDILRVVTGVDNGDPRRINGRIAGRQGAVGRQIHVLGQPDVQDPVRDLDADVVLCQGRAVCPAPDIQLFARALGKRRGLGIVPAEHQRVCGFADVIGNAVDDQPLQFLRPFRGIGCTGRDPGTGREGLRDRGAARLVRQGDVGIRAVRTAAAAHRDSPLHGLGGVNAVAHGRNRHRRRLCRAVGRHVDGLDVIVVQGRIVLHQRIQVIVVIRDPVGAHGGRGIRDLRRPVAVIGPVLVDRLQDFVVCAVDRPLVDFRSFIVGEDTDLVPDDIDIRRIDRRPVVGIPAERVIPDEFGSRRGGRHKAQGKPRISGGGIAHVGIAVGVRVGMAIPAGVVDDVVPAAGYARSAAGTHPLERRGGNPVQGLAGVRGGATGRNEGRDRGQDVRRLGAAAGITDVIALARPGKRIVRAAFRAADDILIPYPEPLAIHLDLIVRGTIDDPGVSAGIPRSVLESHILIPLNDPGLRLCRQHRGNGRPKSQQAGPHGGSRFPAAQRSFAIPAGQFRHDDITIAHAVPDDLVNSVHCQNPPCILFLNPKIKIKMTIHKH